MTQNCFFFQCDWFSKYLQICHNLSPIHFPKEPLPHRMFIINTSTQVKSFVFHWERYLKIPLLSFCMKIPSLTFFSHKKGRAKISGVLYVARCTCKWNILLGTHFYGCPTQPTFWKWNHWYTECHSVKHSQEMAFLLLNKDFYGPWAWRIQSWVYSCKKCLPPALHTALVASVAGRHQTSGCQSVPTENLQMLTKHMHNRALKF